MQAVRGLADRIRTALEESMRQQVTLRGILFTGMTLLVGLAAFVSANNLLFLLLAAMLATLLLSGFISRLGLAALELNLELPEHIAAKRPIAGRLKITNAKSSIPSFSLTFSGGTGSGLKTELYIPIIPGGTTLTEVVELEFARRGLYRDYAFFFTSEFPFGFTRRRAKVHLDREVLVYPPIDPQRGLEALVREIIGELEASRRGAGHDFYRIRPYEALESARHLDWKATAHTRELQVREYSREEDQNVTVLLDLEPSADAAWFERAVAGAAYLVWRLSEAGLRVRLLTQQFDKQSPDEVTAYIMLRYLALVSPVRGLAPPLPHGDRSMQIVLSARPKETARAGWQSAHFPDLADDPAGAGQVGRERRT